MKRILLTAALLALPLVSAFSQTAIRPDTVSGSYRFYYPATLAPEEVKIAATEQARLTALADRYGSVVSGTTNLSTVAITEGVDNASATTKVSSFVTTDVKGEWIADLAAPQIALTYDGSVLNSWVVTVEVVGVVRAVERAAVDFKAMVLRNGTTERHEDYDFVEGDDIYMRFRTPVDGFVAVYLVTESDEAVCLLPYADENSGSTRVSFGYDYVLFSEEAYRNDRRYYEALPDEYCVACDRAIEHDRIYVIFSTSEFGRAASVADNGLQTLSFDGFTTWLTRNTAFDSAMQVKKIGITIRRANGSGSVVGG